MPFGEAPFHRCQASGAKAQTGATPLEGITKIEAREAAQTPRRGGEHARGASAWVATLPMAT